MNDDHQLLPPEIAWYQTPFFRRLIALVCPPLGLLLVWSDANCSRRRRVVATAGILVYCPFYAALLIWLAVLAGVADIEWEGGFGPSIVWHQTTPDYLVLVRNASQMACFDLRDRGQNRFVRVHEDDGARREPLQHPRRQAGQVACRRRI